MLPRWRKQSQWEQGNTMKNTPRRRARSAAGGLRGQRPRAKQGNQKRITMRAVRSPRSRNIVAL